MSELPKIELNDLLVMLGDRDVTIMRQTKRIAALETERATAKPLDVAGADKRRALEKVGGTD